LKDAIGSMNTVRRPASVWMGWMVIDARHVDLVVRLIGALNVTQTTLARYRISTTQR
jgi:hypothetical protein